MLDPLNHGEDHVVLRIKVARLPGTALRDRVLRGRAEVEGGVAVGAMTEML